MHTHHPPPSQQHQHKQRQQQPQRQQRQGAASSVSGTSDTTTLIRSSKGTTTPQTTDHHPPSSPPRPFPFHLSPDRANQLTQPLNDSQSSSPSSPERVSSGERAIRQGPREAESEHRRGVTSLRLRRTTHPGSRSLRRIGQSENTSVDMPISRHLNVATRLAALHELSQQGNSGLTESARARFVQELRRAAGYNVPPNTQEDPLQSQELVRSLNNIVNNGSRCRIARVPGSSEPSRIPVRQSPRPLPVTRYVWEPRGPRGLFVQQPQVTEAKVENQDIIDNNTRIRDQQDEQRNREQRIIAERKELHKAEPPSGAAGGGNDTYELKQTIIEAIKSDINRAQPLAKDLMNQSKQQKIKLSSTRSKSATEPRELFHPIMIDMDLIESLQDNDEIIFQLDKPPYNGYSIPKSFLRDFLTKHEYLQHTKYQCMGTGQHALMITENNIVFEHNNRSFFQFVNGSGLGIPLGLFLRQQLLDALNVREKYFLIHVHENTDINPIVSADEVQWYAPPVLNSTTTHFQKEGEQIPNWAEPIQNIPSNQFIVQKDEDFRGDDETNTQ